MEILASYSLDLSSALQVVVLGLIGGTLSGFIGSGGAFFMTPGMMNLGIPGVIAVGSNLTHKFGKAMVGSREHGKMGHVDKRLGFALLLTAVIGIQIAVWINTSLLKFKKGGGDAASNLYISIVFCSILSVVSISMLRDIIRSRKAEVAGPSRRISEYLSRLHLWPELNFPVADVRISLWVLLLVGLATGYLAGTIGVGGFVGVPAMIYVFGLPTQVATGTELFLAMFMGAYGALSYTYHGMVDLRLTMLLYLGSLVGIHIGVYGTKVVNEVLIRLVTCLIILLCVISRGFAIPVYLHQLGTLHYDAGWNPYLTTASKVLLFASGSGGCLLIVVAVGRAYLRRLRLRRSLDLGGAGTKATPETTGETP